MRSRGAEAAWDRRPPLDTTVAIHRHPWRIRSAEPQPRRSSDFKIGAAVDQELIEPNRLEAPTIADHSQGLEVKIGKEGGVISPSGFAADRTGFVDLVTESVASRLPGRWLPHSKATVTAAHCCHLAHRDRLISSACRSAP